MDSLFLLGTTDLPRWGFSPQALQAHFVELVALKRGGDGSAGKGAKK
jgi:hypothetical protein